MLTVACYRSWEEVEELKEQWNPLLSASSSDTVFLTWEWCSAWWKCYSAGRTPFVLAAWEGEKLVGVAPFYAQPTRSLGQSWMCLRLIGDGSHDSDYLDCFARLEQEAEAIAVFVNFLEQQRSSWDWLEINGPKEGSATVSTLLAHARERRWGTKSEFVPCASLRLPSAWDEYLKSLEPRFRTKVRSSLGFLQQCVGSEPAACRSQQEIETWLPSLFDLHTRRWATEGKPGVFRDSAKRSFYRELSQAALEHGWLAFHRLDWGERALALQFGLLYQNRFHLLQEGYDPDFSAIRPGVALRAWLMRHWIAAGLAEYDFLAGAARYKLDWGASPHLTVRVRVAAKAAGNISALEWPDLVSRSKEALARLAPKALLRARRRLRAFRPHPNGQATNGNGTGASKVTAARLARRVGAGAYSCAPLAGIGRALANRYTWDGQSSLFPLHRRSQPACQIFLFHRVNDDNDPFLGGLPSATFASQIEYISQHFPLVTLDQVANGDFPHGHRYCVAVTFDDGYRDNFVTALPILKKFGVPATVFLATGFIEAGQLPWYDQVRLAFKLTTRKHLSLKELGGPEGSLENLSVRLGLLELTLAWMRRTPQAERVKATSAVFELLGVPERLNLPNQMLRWDEIRQMTKSNILFGAHTVNHPALSQTSERELKDEITGSKRAIENRLQLPVWHFAYPFGQPFDFSAQAKDVVRQAGFKTAVTTVRGLNRPGDDLFQLKRFSPWEADPAMFRMKLDWYRLRGCRDGTETADSDVGATRN